MTHRLDAYVVSYGTPKELEAHLDSWRACPSASVASITVVLVEPSHHDRRVLVGAKFGSLAAYQHHAPLESIIEHSDNVGYNRACNHAASTVGWADTIAWFNADTAVWPGAVDACVDALWSNDEWGVLGPRQIDTRGRITAGGIVGTPDAPKHLHWHRPAARGRGAETRDTDIYIAGSILFTRRATFDTLGACEGWDAGGFWPELQHYYGDAGLCAHVRHHGQRCVFLGEVTMGHEWHRSSKVGGRGEQTAAADKKMMRILCAQHGIPFES